MTDKPQQVILAMDTAGYFNMMARLMGGPRPPAPEDAPISHDGQDRPRPGQPFDMPSSIRPCRPR